MLEMGEPPDEEILLLFEGSHLEGYKWAAFEYNTTRNAMQMRVTFNTRKDR